MGVQSVSFDIDPSQAATRKRRGTPNGNNDKEAVLDKVSASLSGPVRYLLTPGLTEAYDPRVSCSPPSCVFLVSVHFLSQKNEVVAVTT